MDSGAAAAIDAGAAVAIRGLAHSFGELEVLAGLDLTSPPHAVLGLVGPSGCGKSTLLSIIGHQVGSAIQNARLYEEASHRSRQIMTLAKVFSK